MTASVAAIFYSTKDVIGGDQKTLAMVRNCEVNASELIRPAGATANQTCAGITQLSAVGIIAG
jgi:hypothetical protein